MEQERGQALEMRQRAMERFGQTRKGQDKQVKMMENNKREEGLET